MTGIAERCKMSLRAEQTLIINRFHKTLFKILYGGNKIHHADLLKAMDFTYAYFTNKHRRSCGCYNK